MADDEDYIKVCLQCGSTNITIPSGGMDMMMTFMDYCMDCRNTGNFPEMPITSIEEFRRRLNAPK